MENREAGKLLFDQGIAQKEIARVLKVSERTVSAWATEGRWKEKRAEELLRKETSESTVWELIEYQTKVLKIMKDKWLHELERTTPDKIEVKDLKLIARGDIDALQKLYTTVKGKPLEWANIVTIVKELTTYISEQDLELSRLVVPYANEFLNQKRQDLT